MAQLKNTWLIIFLITAGVVIFFLSFQPGRSRNDEGLLLRDIFHKQVQTTHKVADPVPAMGIVTSPVAGHEAGFTIQVYSFQDKNRAYAALSSLKNRGYQAFMVVSDLGEKGVWYRVRIGGIADEAAAHSMLADIRRSYSSGFILKSQ